MLAEIGLGKQLAIVIARKLMPAGAESKQPGIAGPVVIRGSEGMALQFAKCCHPIPGDPIIGFIKNGRGMIIHTHDCPVVAEDAQGSRQVAGRGVGAGDQESCSR